MMRITVKKLIGLTALCWLIQSGGAAAQMFQWTDAKGILHFTDNPQWIPESIRNSAALVVRNDLDVKSPSPVTSAPVAAATTPSVLDRSEVEIPQTATTVVTDAVQEVNEVNTVVVGNPDAGRPHTQPCRPRGHCKPLFRANFSDRRYIHPSVFDGGSRQYIHPGSQSFPTSIHRHPGAHR